MVSGEWEGSYKKTENKTIYKGNFEVPNLSEENDPSEVDINVTIKNEKHFDLKEFMRKEGAQKIREQFAKYLILLKEEFSQGLIKPTKDNAGNLPSSNSNSNKSGGTNETKNSSITSPTNGKKTNEPVRIETKKLSMKEEFKCRSSELYKVFTDINVIFFFFFYFFKVATKPFTRDITIYRKSCYLLFFVLGNLRTDNSISPDT